MEVKYVRLQAGAREVRSSSLPATPGQLYICRGHPRYDGEYSGTAGHELRSRVGLVRLHSTQCFALALRARRTTLRVSFAFAASRLPKSSAPNLAVASCACLGGSRLSNPTARGSTPTRASDAPWHACHWAGDVASGSERSYRAICAAASRSRSSRAPRTSTYRARSVGASTWARREKGTEIEL